MLLLGALAHFQNSAGQPLIGQGGVDLRAAEAGQRGQPGQARPDGPPRG